MRQRLQQQRGPSAVRATDGTADHARCARYSRMASTASCGAGVGAPSPAPRLTPNLEGQITETARQGARSLGRPLDPTTRAFMESRFEHDFSGVRVHTDGMAAAAARVLDARAYTLGRDIVFGDDAYAPATDAGRRLIAHELAHVLQQHGGGDRRSPAWMEGSGDRPEVDARSAAERVLQGHRVERRDLASPGHKTVQRQESAQAPDLARPLSPARVEAAIRYNRASYDEDSTRIIQSLVGVPETERFDEATVQAIARRQRSAGLAVDGKVGPDTYDRLLAERRPEVEGSEDCLTLFQVVGPLPLQFVRDAKKPDAGRFESQFLVHARFDGSCDCGDFEYRQYIAGSVVLTDNHGGRVNMNHLFKIPGGLNTTLREDGDTTIPAGVAGHHYGHRNYGDNSSDPGDVNRPNRAAGCAYAGSDVPSVGPVPAAPGDAGDIYDWDLRYRGIIIRRGYGLVTERYWAIRETGVIPP